MRDYDTALLQKSGDILIRLFQDYNDMEGSSYSIIQSSIKVLI